MKLWDRDAERGALWACIVAITMFLLIIPDPDTDLTIVFPGNPPYSWLWYLLNPLYWTKRAYSMIIFTEWAGITAVEWWLVHKGRLNGGLVKLQIVSTTLLVTLHAYQDVSVIMFGPFLFGFVLEILQKIPLPGTQQWTCAFNGTGTQVTYWTNPCLSSATQWNLLGGHVYALTYFILALWVVLPLILWYKQRHSDKFLLSCGMRVVKMLRGVRGGRVCDSCESCNRDGCTFHEEDVEREESGGKEYTKTPSISTQPSTPSPTKSLSLLDVLLWLSIGATAHDFASYYGLHVEPFHAFYYTLPGVAILLWMKWRRWRK